MMVVTVVPGEELPAEDLGVLDAAEPFWKLRRIFQGFEVAFREGIVVGCVKPAAGFGDAQICQHERSGLCRHGWATVGMEGEFFRRHAMLGDAVLEQRLGQGSILSVGDMPPDRGGSAILHTGISGLSA